MSNFHNNTTIVLTVALQQSGRAAYSWKGLSCIGQSDERLKTKRLFKIQKQSVNLEKRMKLIC